MPKNSNLIHLENVTLVRGGKTILKNLSWTVKRGEHWFLLGANGSGKTSLLELVVGYLWATKGKVEVLGEAYGKTNLPELRKKVGYVAPWVYKRIKSEEIVREVVAGGLEASIEYYKGLTADVNAKVKLALLSVGCSKLIGRTFSRLSSGEQLKVLIARALVNRPAVLILDEPFSALDFGSRHSVYKSVQKMGQYHKNTSIILVTHHFDDIRPLYSHGILLKQGGIVAKGRKSSVLTSKNLSRTFGLGLDVTKAGSRYLVK